VGSDYNVFKENVEADMLMLYKDTFKEVAASKDLYLDAILNYVVADGDKNQAIDIWTRGPRAFIYKIDDNFYVKDFTGIVSVFQYLTKEVARLDNKSGNLRAEKFETSVVSACSENFGKESVLFQSRRISAEGKSREIDCGFVFQNFLFLLEAKSKNVSFAFDKGDPKALEYRKKEFQTALKEADDKALFIQTNYKVLKNKYHLPFEYIVPLAISSFAEYIWEKSQDLFLDKQLEIPRIITIRDISTLKTLDLDFLIVQKFVVKIDTNF
jgi:hypothetical protein